MYLFYRGHICTFRSYRKGSVFSRKGYFNMAIYASVLYLLQLFGSFPREFLGAHHHVMHAPTIRRCILSADKLCRTIFLLDFVFSPSRGANGPSLFSAICSCAHSLYDWQVLYRCGRLLMKENRIPPPHPPKLPQQLDEHFVFSFHQTSQGIL